MRSATFGLVLTLVCISCSGDEPKPEEATIDRQQLIEALERSDLSPAQDAVRDELISELTAERTDSFNRKFVQGVLEDRYNSCLVNASFDAGGVQIIWSEDGSPSFVKTGHDVPAEFHGPCWTAIGGDTNGMSSWNEDG